MKRGNEYVNELLRTAKVFFESLSIVKDVEKRGRRRRKEVVRHAGGASAS